MGNAPATFVVLLIAGALLVLGATILGSGARRERGPTATQGVICSRCRHRNVGEARFCAKCGARLHD